MADPTFAEQMVTKYQGLLLANAGLQTVNIDGSQVSMTDLEAKYDHWAAKVAKEQTLRPKLIEVQFSGGA